jgi:hypothetical protein
MLQESFATPKFSSIQCYDRYTFGRLSGLQEVQICGMSKKASQESRTNLKVHHKMMSCALTRNFNLNEPVERTRIPLQSLFQVSVSRNRGLPSQESKGFKQRLAPGGEKIAVKLRYVTKESIFLATTLHLHLEDEASG